MEPNMIERIMLRVTAFIALGMGWVSLTLAPPFWFGFFFFTVVGWASFSIATIAAANEKNHS
jgi:hypothetical protein